MLTCPCFAFFNNKFRSFVFELIESLVANEGISLVIVQSIVKQEKSIGCLVNEIRRIADENERQ